MSDQLFLRDRSYYRRDIDPIGQYVEQSALYLSKMTGDPLDQCRTFVREEMKTSAKNPTVTYFYRNEVGDRSVERISLAKYIKTLCTEDLVLAPTFTCYKSEKKLPSKLAAFVDENKKRRSVAKKESARAKVAGDTVKAVMKNNEQSNMKTYNNSMSGAFGAGGTIFYNPTAHNTLTSTIRSVSSFGNASNERVVMGNRHFYSEDIILFNLICYCSQIDRVEIAAAMGEFGLKVPDVQDVMDTIEYSSRFYIQDPAGMQRIRTFVERMDDIERSAFCYIGDLYRIRVLNDGFMRDFITKLSSRVDGHVPDAVERIRKIDPQILNYAHQIAFSDMKDRGKEYQQMPIELVSMLVLTSENILSTLKEYSSIIKAFFLTKMVPASHAYIQFMMRRSVVLSDTDSTCFSTDDWMLWYFGKLDFSDRAFAVCGAVSYLACEAVSHLLAILSSNINAAPERLHDLAMKNEYLWTAHMVTNVAKHYAALTVMQEGDVYGSPTLEIKGVHLKNSAAPPTLIAQGHKLITELLEKIASGQLLNIRGIAQQVQNIEQDIIRSLQAGENTYLKQSKVKDSSAYSLGPEESPYQHYILWQEVFEPKYGRISPPPYGSLMIPTTLSSRLKLQTWLDGIEDRELATRMSTWVARKHKTSLETLYIPNEYVTAFGIPTEILSVMDIEKITIDLTLIFRIILESLGFFVKPDSLVSSYRL